MLVDAVVLTPAMPVVGIRWGWIRRSPLILVSEDIHAPGQASAEVWRHGSSEYVDELTLSSEDDERVVYFDVSSFFGIGSAQRSSYHSRPRSPRQRLGL
jgi:hypothetical protein